MARKDKIITRTLHTGEIVFKEGDPGQDVFLILSGSVEVYKTVNRSRQLINNLGGGEIFGEMGPLTNEPRYASVVATEKTRLIVVNNRSFYSALINDQMPIIKPLATQLVLRLKEAEDHKQQGLLKIRHLENELVKARRN